jgi:hypothetical protein
MTSGMAICLHLGDASQDYSASAGGANCNFKGALAPVGWCPTFQPPVADPVKPRFRLPIIIPANRRVPGALSCYL